MWTDSPCSVIVPNLRGGMWWCFYIKKKKQKQNKTRIPYGATVKMQGCKSHDPQVWCVGWFFWMAGYSFKNIWLFSSIVWSMNENSPWPVCGLLPFGWWWKAFPWAASSRFFVGSTPFADNMCCTLKVDYACTSSHAWTMQCVWSVLPQKWCGCTIFQTEIQLWPPQIEIMIVYLTKLKSHDIFNLPSKNFGVNLHP